MPIVMKTERLHLRQVEGADLVSLDRIYADRECMQFYPGTKLPSEISTWFQKLAFDSYAQHGFGLWAVVDAVSGEVIGDCGITLQETPAGLEPEIGYHLWREYWGMGLATEAAIACRDYAFRSLGLRRVVSITSPENIPSQKVAEQVHDRLEIYQKRRAESGNVVSRHLYISENR
ncbi:GNAT family N-acetyltransferase [Agrobacterium tumefaciens]|uniref:GNAT family N-acetyltransferase n=1 Tax=Agrobacterium tumefaciens TaxID=358 RepID=UPI00157316F7|nr:GNAT family N-acetyltransferase [Agrobacterium tumefaciens]WCK05117.1 GNAT family N-acetyltransferase [Agrobacterium tumefaciens]